MTANITCFGFNLAPASYAGVSFWVENDKEAYGRRIVTHEYPMRDDPYHEDLGEKAQEFTVTGYVVGDDATSQKEAVVAACRRRGPALLQLPAKQAFMARCKTLTVTRRKDEQSYFVLTMDFVADRSGGMFSAIGMFEALIGSVLTSMAAPMSVAFSAVFASTNVLPFVIDNAVARVVYGANAINEAFAGIDGQVQSPVTAQISTRLLGMMQNAETLVNPGPSDPPSVTMIETLAGVFYDALDAYSPSGLVAALKPLASFTYLERTDVYGRAGYGFSGATTSQNLSSASVLADANNAAVFNGAIRCFALVALASAVSSTAFTSRADAVQARADLVELINQQIERMTDEDVVIALTEARDYAVKAISQNSANMTPVVVVNAPMSLPVLYWVNRLYADATRAEELAERNNVATPAFMPQSFQALVE